MKMRQHSVRFHAEMDERFDEACKAKGLTPLEAIREAVGAWLDGDNVAEHVAREVRQALQTIAYNARRDIDAAAKDTLKTFNDQIKTTIMAGVSDGVSRINIE